MDGGVSSHRPPPARLLIPPNSKSEETPKADGMILSKEEESDAEVRRVDQDRINEFGRLNARLHEVRDEVNKLKVSESILFEHIICFPTRISPLIIARYRNKYL